MAGRLVAVEVHGILVAAVVVEVAGEDAGPAGAAAEAPAELDAPLAARELEVAQRRAAEVRERRRVGLAPAQRAERLGPTEVPRDVRRGPRLEDDAVLVVVQGPRGAQTGPPAPTPTERRSFIVSPVKRSRKSSWPADAGRRPSAGSHLSRQKSRTWNRHKFSSAAASRRVRDARPQAASDAAGTSDRTCVASSGGRRAHGAKVRVSTGGSGSTSTSSGGATSSAARSARRSRRLMRLHITEALHRLHSARCGSRTNSCGWSGASPSSKPSMITSEAKLHFECNMYLRGGRSALSSACVRAYSVCTW